MSEISAATVYLVLDYLSSLSAPLPPHLLSAPLLQRHHFLHLSPDSLEEYLAWPSDTRSHAVNLLQSLPFPAHDEPLPVQYLPDPEYIQAHVRISPDLRLVFLLHQELGWQYHNVDLMPFPPSSYVSFQDALRASSPEDFLPEQNTDFQVQPDDDDSYWNAYGQGDDDPDSHSSATRHLDPNQNSEDAYWARYSAVQGSGDSTLPSPRPPQKKLAESDIPLPERIIVPSDEFQINHVELYNPLEPPPPESLTRRLEALSASSGSDSPPLFDNYPTSDVPSISPLDNVPALSSSSSTASPKQLLSDEFIVVDQDTNHVDDPTQNILHDSIKNLYQLWKLSRKDNDVQKDKVIFLHTVRQAVEEL